jgi:hypothetical protein
MWLRSGWRIVRMMRTRSLMIERCIAGGRLPKLELRVGILSMSGLYICIWRMNGLSLLLPLC